MEPAAATRKPVLLVEDDPEIRRLLRTLLEKHGYAVLEAPHGQAALELLARTSLPGVILLDLYLPVMDGWEFRLAQRKDSRLAALPVVVISAAADSQIEPIDAEQILKKPLETRRLLEIVASYCGEPTRADG